MTVASETCISGHTEWLAFWIRKGVDDNDDANGSKNNNNNKQEQ